MKHSRSIVGEKDEEIKDTFEYNLLKTAVSDVVELRAIQDTVDQLRVNSGKTQTYSD